jgi:hypothetical protein
VCRRGCLLFGAAYPIDEIRPPLEKLWEAGKNRSLPFDSSIRPGIAIDRQLGTVRKHLLFTTETLPDWMVFQAKVLGDTGEHENLFQKSVHVQTHFGAGAARGLGRSVWRLA